MTNFEWISLVSAIFSIILAIMAIGFSGFFFWLSKKQSDGVSDAATRIETSVKHLDFVTQKLYDDLFSLVRENFGKLQDHALDRPVISQNEIEAREAIRQQELEKVREDLKPDVEGLSAAQFSASSMHQRLEGIEALIDKTIEQVGTASSSATMAYGKMQVEEILLHLDGAGLIEIGDLLLKVDLSQSDLFAVLSSMQDEGTIDVINPMRSRFERKKVMSPEFWVPKKRHSVVVVSEEMALDSYVYHRKFEDDLE